MKKQPVKVSFFIHRWEKKSTVIFLDEFVTDVRGERWKVMTLAHRDYLRRQMLKEADDVKSKMPGIVAAGVCQGGHAASQVHELSQLLMLDLDKVNERLQEIVALLRTLPYVALQLISISGVGIKVLVRVEVENAQQYATAYAVVAGEVSRLVGFPCDMQCRDLGRICSGVWDADVYYQPDVVAFPWQERVQEVANTARPDAAMSDAALPDVAGGFMLAFLNEFGQRNVFVQGERHDFILKLGRVARYKGFSSVEMTLLKELVFSRFAESDFSMVEIEKTLFAGYQYAISAGTPPVGGAWVHKAQGSLLAYPTPQKDDEDDLSEKSKELRRNASYFPKEIYDRLPHLLHTGVQAARSDRERDMLLMGMLANISGCLPGVQILYDQLYFSPHFYFTQVSDLV